MIKKILTIIAILLILISVSAYHFLPKYAVGLVKEYDPYTFERVLLDDTMRINYGIYNHESPKDYGFRFQDVSYSSIYDKNELSAWFVPSTKPTDKTILLIHGRWSNRLKTMKYLEIVDQYKLDSTYNVMIPDLRNSGKSEFAETMMGYKFAEDIASTVIWLSENHQQSEIYLYGFSMGGMAVITLLNRDDLMDEMNSRDIKFPKVIVDSPIANVEKILRIGGDQAGLPQFVVDKTLDQLNYEFDGFVGRMKFSFLLERLEMPILILQGTNDTSQPLEILQGELDQLSKRNIQLEIFQEGEHVKLYQVDQHQKRYSSLIGGFLSPSEVAPTPP